MQSIAGFMDGAPIDLLLLMAAALIGAVVWATCRHFVPPALLRQGNRRAEKYLNIAGSIFVALDHNAKVTMINDYGAKLLQWSKDDLIGRDWIETAIPEEERSMVRGAFNQAMSGALDLVERFENRVVDRHGSIHQIAWHNSVMRDGKGKIVGTLSSGNDITKYRTVVDALKVSQTRFNQSQEFANIGTWDWNIKTGELYWSDRIAPLFGHAKGELETTYENFLGAIHPDDRQSVIDAVNACVEHRKPYDIEHRVVWPNGMVRWLHEKGDVVRDGTGAPINMLGVVQDITQRKWSDGEIKRLSRNNTLILNAAGDGIYGVDLDGLCTFVNPAAARMLGWSSNELIGMPNHDLMHHSRADGSAYPRTECPIYAAFRDGQVHTVTNEVFWRKDGTSFPVEYTSTAIYEDGEIRGAVVVFRDVSERNILQEQLIQSSKMATLGEMATGVAHELNQPLNVIRMAVNNIQSRITKGEADTGYLNAKLDKVVSQVERASAIIDHMRIFGRKPSGTYDRISVRRIVDGSLSLIGEQLRLSDIEVIKDYQSDGIVLGHQVQIEQVMLNLLANARDALRGKATGQGMIIVRTKVDTDAGVAILEVEDNAGGIADDVLPRVFEPFFTTKDVGQGTGLGLSISYGIIRDMGGEIRADNTDHGARFTIRLPLAAEQQAA